LILSNIVSCLASLHCKISFEVSDTAVMMRSISSTVSTVSNGGLLARDFFHNEGFFGEPFLFLDVSISVRGFLGGVTLPCSCFSSSPSSSSLSTSSPPPPSGESGVASSDALCVSCTSSFFFFFFFLGPSYSSWVTTGLPMRSRSESYVCSTGTRNSTGHSFVIYSMSSSVSL
jgi:hypothetical protein